MLRGPGCRSATTTTDNCHPKRRGSTAQDLDAEDFTRLAFHHELEWTTADLAIGGDSLVGNAGVQCEFKGLTAVRTLNSFGNFHQGETSSQAAGKASR